MCNGRFIPVFKWCPKGLRNSAVTFLWVLCSHLSGKMWREMRDGSCSCGFRFDGVQLHQRDPADGPVHGNTATRHTRQTYLFQWKQHNHFTGCWHGAFQSNNNSNQVQCANAFISPPSNNHPKKWKEKKSPSWSIRIHRLQLQEIVACGFVRAAWIWLPFTDYWCSVMFFSVKIISTLNALLWASFVLAQRSFDTSIPRG